jgi:hypothetical protein
MTKVSQLLLKTRELVINKITLIVRHIEFQLVFKSFDFSDDGWDFVVHSVLVLFDCSSIIGTDVGQANSKFGRALSCRAEISKIMSKFDRIYEDIVWSLRENVNTTYLGDNFKTAIEGVVGSLISHEYLKGDPDTIVAQLLHQHGPIKTLNLDMKDGALPPTAIQFIPGEKPADPTIDQPYEVKVILIDKPKGDPTRSKTFQNTVEETIVADILAYIQTVITQNLSPASAVQQQPPATGANAQPGEAGGESALPGVAPEAPTPAPANG